MLKYIERQNVSQAISICNHSFRKRILRQLKIRKTFVTVIENLSLLKWIRQLF